MLPRNLDRDDDGIMRMVMIDDDDNNDGDGDADDAAAHEDVDGGDSDDM